MKEQVMKDIKTCYLSACNTTTEYEAGRKLRMKELERLVWCLVKDLQFGSGKRGKKGMEKEMRE